MVVDNTPWEIHKIKNRTIHVKREDLCCPYPGPSFSKIRGIEKYIKNRLNNEIHSPDHFGVVDSIHSKAGWGVSYVCHELKIPCTVFYPILKSEKLELRPFQKECEKLGAELISLPATKSAVLWYQARKIFQEKYNNGELLPTGLKLQETIRQTAREVIINTPRLFLRGTWIVSVSSGTIAAGVIQGLDCLGFRGKFIAHMGFSRSIPGMMKYLRQFCFGHFDIQIVDEGYAYKDKIEFKAPFPCNSYYDLKAWKWLNENLGQLKSPIIFWNIGA